MSNTSSKDSHVEVYFNSACPVCNAGINYQKKRLHKHLKNAQKINWNDIHLNKACLSHTDDSPELNVNFVRERLHVKDACGNMHIGIDAFIELWEISGEKWKSNFLRLPVIHSLATIFYNVFAFALYRWNIYRRHW